MTGRRVRMLPWDPLWRLRHVGYPVSPRGYRGLPAFASLSMAGSERTATIREQARIIDQTHDAVVTTDMEGRITSWNGGAEKVFGYRAEEARGKHISLVYPAEQLEFLEKQVILPLQAKGTHEVEVTLRRENGTCFPAHLSLSLLHDEEGNPKGMVGYTVDISEIKRRENELQELAAKLEASNRELESFSYSVSHDLRAPLRAIDGFSLALLEDYDDRLDDTARDYLRRVRGGAQRMGALIDDLLQLSRVNRGEIEYRKVDRCPPWRAKRRRVVPGSREATRDTRRAEGAKGDPKGASERGVQSYGRPVCSRNELAMLWRNAG